MVLLWHSAKTPVEETGLPRRMLCVMSIPPNKRSVGVFAGIFLKGDC